MIIPGILILSGNKTYGRVKTNSAKEDKSYLDGRVKTNSAKEDKSYLDKQHNVGGKLLYKVYPHINFSQDPCLIPYEIKHLGFSKSLSNLYVCYNSETLRLEQVIGSVDSPESFTEYQLYVHGLKQSINPLRKKITDKIKSCSDPIDEIATRLGLIKSSHPNIFSIDPETSKDFDDAFSITRLGENLQVSIYIANVPVWLQWLGITLDELPRASTIYLPNTIYPMLPSILSDDLCSLWEGKKRLAFVLELEINLIDGKIKSKKFSNQLIQVKTNWSYSDPKLETNTDYQILKSLTCLCKSQTNLDSHQVVEYWMCQMNLIVGQELVSRGIGIFRQAQMDINKIATAPSDIPDSIAKTIQLIQCANASYVEFSADLPIPIHEILNVDSYLHVTSPIRRIVDIINMGLLQQSLNLSLNIFDQTSLWTVEKINKQTQSIKIVQNKSRLLELITSRFDPDEVLEGWICSSEGEEDTFRTQIYIPKYKLQVQIKTCKHTYTIYSKCNVKLYLFVNADTLAKKVQAEIIK